MPTLNAAYSEAEAIALEAAALGRLSPEQAEVLRSFFAELEKNALAVYQAARLVASHTYDRQEIAKFWKGEAELAAHARKQLNLLKRSLALGWKQICSPVTRIRKPRPKRS